ncbi:hypothetical protein BZA05DRAFT_396917 [Tricharina praecox]|uniref:uncharacterized protein n=1 Tax=Tricharina praecox TaxID=43433 RepID=UPI00222072BA|nr:uncharacterized protein BZA05DRAFT_396917 [Tricharina praecox]KAI5852129.1 hypothetical protein BZA05DRAFT_396917 [Tricharina praecox]
MQSAGPPLSLYPLPSPPASPILHDRRNSFMPKRRNSLGRLLSRGYQSSPDLSGMSEDSDEGAMPPMPTKPYSKPSSAGVPSRARTLRRRATEKGRADIEKPTSYTEQEKMEHESILGADPAGYGFYLYPKTSTLSPQRNSYVGGSGSSDSGSPVDGGSGRPSHGRRTWKEAKGRSFRRTVTSQIIMEEECGDSSETAPIAQPQRRHSMAPGIDSQWRAPRQDAGSVGQPTLNGGNNNAARRRSLHNSWDQLSSQIQRHDGPFPALELPQRRRSDQLHDGEEAALRRLQLEANRFMIRTEDVDDTDADDDFGVRPVADRGSGGGSSRNSNVPVPALRVEMVNV